MFVPQGVIKCRETTCGWGGLLHELLGTGAGFWEIWKDERLVPTHPWWTFIRTGWNQLRFFVCPFAAFCAGFEALSAPDSSPHPWVPPQNPFFQQIPYLSSRECLEQLKIVWETHGDNESSAFQPSAAPPWIAGKWGTGLVPAKKESWKSMFIDLVSVISLAC